ncbi:UreD-domain-containing protein [Patellaria atrata CBS 101060]|uniref:UreD-domain-containing protein n=1 Tax=Patellaria atrata CBS 101060 TaxID=1346257 RepID=A0A9P4VJM2_9PEZI|nr:UreD-domain-containing protein [Patellaria atrata CBS 101060]
MTNPFAPSSSKPGHGTIKLALLPPSTPILQTLSYQYPLKLISPPPLRASNSSNPILIHAVYLLTYGGGIVAGDTLDLTIHLARRTRLTLLTQGSTKIFKSTSRDIISRQRTTVDLESSAALCYLPDPVQPFARSAFEQTQVYNLRGGDGSLCVCDWVCEGRSARGEKWGCWRYTSKNEVWGVNEEGKRRLLLRDNLLLEEGGLPDDGFVGRMDGMGVFGTLILRGPHFKTLAEHFVSEFALLPRIGGRKWDAEEEKLSVEEERRVMRQEQETKDGLLWTSASLRGFVLVKFGAREVEGAKRWLREMLIREGTVEREFGERALLCLK